MTRHAETRLFPYAPDQIFDMVADVARYPEFLPWIVAARVRSRDETEMVADLIVGFKAIRQQFSSRVLLARPTSIRIDYLDGPMSHLNNDWQFSAAAEGCRVDFAVDFAFRSRLFETVAGQMFDSALRRMIGAFEARAACLYGQPQ